MPWCVSSFSALVRAWESDGDLFLDGRWPPPHHQHAIGELHGLFDVVRDEEEGLSLGLPDADEVGAHLEAGEDVERAERLVHVEHVGLRGEGAGDLHPLPHPPRRARADTTSRSP
jgi:hypothetical protein